MDITPLTGAVVKIVSAWRDASDADTDRYLVLEDNGDRLIVSPIGSDLTLVPQELMRRDMVEVAS